MAQSTVRLIVDAQNAISPLRKVNDATKNLNKNTNKLKDSLNKSNRSIRETGAAAKSASGGFATLNKSLGPLLKALAAIAAVRFVFVQSAEIETQRKSLEVLTGSLSKTNKIIQELQDFGSVTPFTSSELIEQAKRLKAFGFETSELADSVKRLSDIAGATGADLSGIATAFGQIRAKGKLQQEENLQLLERGVDITTELKRITGLQGDAFESAMRKGKIGADLVNEAFINLTNEGGAFFGGATAQADTLNGKLSTLIDAVQGLARTVGEVLGPAIKFVLSTATSAVQTVDKIIKRIQSVTKIGLSGVLESEKAARKTAERLTKLKFGDDVNLGFFGNAEAKAFQKEQFDMLVKQNIEREKLRQKTFEEVEIIEEVNQNSNKTVQIVETINNGLSQEVDLLEKSNLALFTQTEQADKLKQKFDEIGQSVEDNLVQNLTDAVMGAQTLGDALSNVLKGLQRQLIEMAMQKAVGGIGGVFSGFLGNIFGGGGGGGATSLITDNVFSTGFDTSGLFKKARGGPVSAGGAFLVGERGPEILQMGSKGGNIIPNNKIGGNTTNVVVNVDASGTQAEGDDQSSRQLGELIAAAVQSEIVRQQMSGGLLS